MNTIGRMVLEGLRRIAGRRRKSEFAEPPPRPYLEVGYRDMAADEAREAEAKEWSEALVGDIDAV